MWGLLQLPGSLVFGRARNRPPGASYAEGTADDAAIHQHITALVDEEHQLRRRLTAGEISRDEEHARLATIEVELDQAWDLLRQRDAKRQYADNPETARERSPGIVEGYLG